MDCPGAPGARLDLAAPAAVAAACDIGYAMSVTSSVWTRIPADTAQPPTAEPVASLSEALGLVSRELRSSSHAVKDRVDLVELAEPVAGVWRGEIYAQTLLIPDAVFEEVKALHGTKPLVLLPPRAGGACIAVRGSQSSTTDGIVMVMDAFGAVKGLAPNNRAKMLCAACGLAEEEPRGDIFFGRLNHEADGSLTLGADAAPTMIVQREWLEAAQAAHKSGEFDIAAAGMAAQVQEQVLAVQKFAAFAAAGDMEGAGAAAAGQVAPSSTAAATTPTAEREIGKLDWEDQVCCDSMTCRRTHFTLPCYSPALHSQPACPHSMGQGYSRSRVNVAHMCARAFDSARGSNRHGPRTGANKVRPRQMYRSPLPIKYEHTATVARRICQRTEFYHTMLYKSCISSVLVCCLFSEP